MKKSVIKTVKFAAGACAALGLVTLGAVVASGTAVKIVAEGLKAGAETMKKTINELRTEPEAQAEECCCAGEATPTAPELMPQYRAKGAAAND